MYIVQKHFCCLLCWKSVIVIEHSTTIEHMYVHERSQPARYLITISRLCTDKSITHRKTNSKYNAKYYIIRIDSWHFIFHCKRRKIHTVKFELKRIWLHSIVWTETMCTDCAASAHQRGLRWFIPYFPKNVYDNFIYINTFSLILFIKRKWVYYKFRILDMNVIYYASKGRRINSFKQLC